MASARQPFSIQHSALPAQRAGSGERPTAIQHSALSIQHCPRDARAVASARQPFSIQHSAFSIARALCGPFRRCIAASRSFENRGHSRTIKWSVPLSPYQPCEAKFRRTRALLEELQGSGIRLSIATKSDLVLRDLDLIKTFPGSRVSFSINTLDEGFRREMDCAEDNRKADFGLTSCEDRVKIPRRARLVRISPCGRCGP